MQTLAVLALMATFARAEFMVTGVFGSDRIGTTGLANGSFDAVFEVTGLPAPDGGSLIPTSFTVHLRDSSGTTLYTLTNSASDYGFVFGNVNVSGLDTLAFRSLLDTPTILIQLAFQRPYLGTGTVIPTDNSGNFSYASITDQTGATIGAVDVTSGTSIVQGVPEPSSLMLMGIAGVTAMGYGWRRRLMAAA